MTIPTLFSTDVQGINASMKKLLAYQFCPHCKKHNVLHDDEQCSMRWEKEEEEVHG